MNACELQAAGTIELYFYDELPAGERRDVEVHLRRCSACRSALEDLEAIGAALARCPDVAGPERGDWSRFMVQLDAALASEPSRMASPVAAPARASIHRASFAAPLAMAALLTLVTGSVGYLARHRPPRSAGATAAVQEIVSPPPPAAAPHSTGDAALVAVSEQHFERSKLVILGLANRDPQIDAATDWAYERQLADRSSTTRGCTSRRRKHEASARWRT